AARVPCGVAGPPRGALVHALELPGRKLSETVALPRPPGIRGCRRGGPGTRLHIAALPAGHVVTRRGLPVTSAVRTVVDLARASSFQAGVVAADSALRSRQVSAAHLELRVAAFAHSPGIPTARRVAPFADGRAGLV